jgi:hypothetical protein
VLTPEGFDHLIIKAVAIGSVGPALLFVMLDWKATKLG